MIRRLGAALAALILLTIAPVAPVTAYHTIPSCTADIGPKWVVDYFTPSPEGNAIGVRAQIDVSGDAKATSFFGPCFNDVSTYDTGSFAYVGLQRTTNSTQYVTLGSTRCFAPSWAYRDPCDHIADGYRPDLRYFIRVNGCISERWIDLGAADFGIHGFKINSLSTPPRFVFYIDDVLVYTIDKTDSRVNCWGNDPKRTIVGGQIMDDGDILGKGDSYGNKTLFQNFANRPYGSTTWEAYSPQCSYYGISTPHPLQCSYGGNYMYVWSANVP